MLSWRATMPSIENYHVMAKQVKPILYKTEGTKILSRYIRGEWRQSNLPDTSQPFFERLYSHSFYADSDEEAIAIFNLLEDS